ncbi:MAG: hypothetical protein WA952_10015, partial [Lewinella sp.]
AGDHVADINEHEAQGEDAKNYRKENKKIHRIGLGDTHKTRCLVDGWMGNGLTVKEGSGRGPNPPEKHLKPIFFMRMAVGPSRQQHTPHGGTMLLFDAERTVRSHIVFSLVLQVRQPHH